MKQVIFKKVNSYWVEDSGVFSFLGTKAGEINQWMKKHHPDTKVGFKASDIGPVIAFECERQGFGDVLWMK